MCTAKLGCNCAQLLGGVRSGGSNSTAKTVVESYAKKCCEKSAFHVSRHPPTSSKTYDLVYRKPRRNFL
jgi:hypothetical protein